jgi:hypothetical protein
MRFARGFRAGYDVLSAQKNAAKKNYVKVYNENLLGLHQQKLLVVKKHLELFEKVLRKQALLPYLTKMVLAGLQLHLTNMNKCI